jgi:uncharacterized lipoprotein YajG
MIRNLLVIFSLVPALVLTGCSVKLSNSITLPYVGIREGLLDVGKGAMVSIEVLSDSRAQKSIAQGPNGPIEAVGDVPAAVRETIESMFTKSGFSVSDSAPTAVQVELKEWRAVYKSSYPSALESSAAFILKVYDPGDKLAYTGSYSGTSSVEGSGLDDRALKDSLATALSEAIDQLSRDKQLLKLLSAF